MSESERNRSDFVTTRWSLVLAVRDHSSEEAVVELCRRYWFPLYAFVRRTGCGREDAEDLTQGFFAEFLEKGYFSRADPQRGRFRNYLLTSIKNFMVKKRRRDRSQKRGGGVSLVSWDQTDAESRYASELAVEVSPEVLYDQQWARSLLDRVLAELDSDFARRDRAEIFRQIKQHLWGEAREVPYQELTDRAQMSVGAFKIAVHRVRQQFRDLMRAEVADTVSDTADIDEELRHLVSVLSQGSRAS